MKIAENIYFYKGDPVNPGKIYRGMGSSNFVVVKGPEQILFDTGIFEGPHSRRIKDEMRADGVDIGETRHILFTHYHPDHTAGARALMKKHGPKLWFHGGCENYLHDSRFQFQAQMNLPKYIRREIYFVPDFLAKLFVGYLGYDYKYFRPDHLFSSGETLHINGIQILPVDTSGHCPGHVSYYLPDCRVMISGDVFTVDHFCGTAINNPEADYERSIADIDRLLGMKIDILMPSHDDVVYGGGARDVLKRARETMTEMPLRVLALLGGSSMTLTQIFHGIFGGGRNLGFRFLYSNITYNVLRYMRRKKLVKDRLHRGRVLWSAEQAGSARTDGFVQSPGSEKPAALAVRVRKNRKPAGKKGH